ncbi:hypothetical protein HNP84_009302 [Thermocatellispora tengchongensis]|uniref:Uncharacterized protein n=1 Tax=Thermocatellispora tengchongensis TaxID=1073253 RepID=A0A840PKR9_9ACTN|nr:hypothetical protein [Thermocatellispora tengchongensis]MBB5139539.1 hypothetical protein [Thermocatellispora tengchongensis]
MSAVSRSLVGATALGLVLLVSGCGGDEGTAAAPQGGGDQRAAFRDCLREHGVTMPTARPSDAPGARPDGGATPGARRSTDPAARQAMQACASLRPSGAPGPGDRAGRRALDQSALRAFRTCMKDNGVTLATDAPIPRAGDTDATTAKALEKCRPLLPTPTP